MRWGAAGPWLALCVLLLCCAIAPARAAVTVLRDATGTLDAQEIARAWVDPTGEATLQQVQRSAHLFQPATPGVIHRLPAEGALWMHLRLQRGTKERQDWVLKLPMPVVDHVTLHQQEGSQWRAESAGDTLAVDRWPERGRYPVFRLDLPAGETRDLYVRVQHSTPAQFPLELATAAQHTASLQGDYLGLGVALGGLMLLIAGCLATGWTYRDPALAWYAAYAALTSLAIAAYTGVAGQFLWPSWDWLRDAPTNMLACVAVGAAVLFVRNTLGLRRRLPALDRLGLVLGCLAPAVALLAPALSKAAFLQAMGAYVCIASSTALLMSAMGWRRGDAVARWVFAAQAPLVGAVVLTVTRNLGWIDLPFVPQAVVILSLAIEVPLLLVALFMRSRDRHSAEVREQALTTHDALTGLLAPHLFHDRLTQVVGRFRRDGQDAAVMYIDLVNHARIRAVYGGAVAEQSLLRSVIKLRRLLRDVDTVSRVGEARFGVILEGATARNSVLERATRLIAAGLMPLQGLKPDVTLQFHVAAVLLSERAMEAEELQLALAGRLATMSPRTRRPIRFLEPEPEQPTAPEPGDSAFPQGLDLDLDADESAMPA